MNESGNNTTLLLKAWYDGNQEALNALLEKQMPIIRSMVRKRLGQFLHEREESGDMVQEAVFKFLRYAPQIEITNGKLLTALLVRVIESVLLDKHNFYTRYKRRTDNDQPLDSQCVLHLDTPSKIVVKKEQSEWVRLGVLFLNDVDREVIALREWEDLSYVDIGKQLELTPNSARMRHDRAMGRLSEIMGQLRRQGIENILSESGHSATTE